MIKSSNRSDMLTWTKEIVAAHVRSSTVPVQELPQLIESVHQALAGLSDDGAVEKPQPAVPVRRSVTPDYIVCLEDGRKLKMLKRHLSTAYQMTPAEYREKWDLPADYPMVAPNYARQRSSLAKKIGLGRRPRVD